MKKFLNFFIGFLIGFCLTSHAKAQVSPYGLQIFQVDPTGTFYYGRWFTPPVISSNYFLMYDGTSTLPKMGAIGSGLSWDGTTISAAPANPVNFGDPANRTLSVSTVYQASDPTKASIVTLSPTCTNSTTVVAASTCTLTVHQSNLSNVSCSSGTVVATWNSSYALGLLLTNTSGSPFDVKLGIGRYFIICPVAGTFTITTAVDQTIG